MNQSNSYLTVVIQTITYLFREIRPATLENVVRSTKREVALGTFAGSSHSAARLKVVAGLAVVIDVATHRRREIRIDCLELFNNNKLNLKE